MNERTNLLKEVNNNKIVINKMLKNNWLLSQKEDQNIYFFHQKIKLKDKYSNIFAYKVLTKQNSFLIQKFIFEEKLHKYIFFENVKLIKIKNSRNEALSETFYITIEIIKKWLKGVKLWTI